MRGLFNFTGTKSQISNLDSSSFEEALNNSENPELVDVRTPEENSELRIPNSRLMNLMSPSFMDEISSLDKNADIFLYCRSGNRSLYAAKEMARMGYENVYNLRDGIIGWYGRTESDYNN